MKEGKGLKDRFGGGWGWGVVVGFGWLWWWGVEQGKKKGKDWVRKQETLTEKQKRI